jgi:hypothetical protein
MKVEARIFAPPGRGVFYLKDTTMPDTSIPGQQGLAVTRSLAALKHFWPTYSVRFNLAKVSSVEVTHGLDKKVDWVRVTGEYPVSLRPQNCTTLGPCEWEVVWRINQRVPDDAGLMRAISSLNSKQLSTQAALRTPTNLPITEAA